MDIATALSSGLAGPTVGALLVLLAWLGAKWRHGTPLRDQLQHAAAATVPFLVPAAAAGGLALVASATWQQALTLAVAALLTAAGFSAPRAAP